MSDAASESRELLIGTLREWVRRQVLPVACELELRDEYPADLVQEMREMGLFGAVIDPAYGGAGLTYETYVAAVEEISRGWMTLAGIFNSHLILAHLVERFGSDEQRERFLPGLTSGEAQGALALTEPGAGSDVQAIITTARKDGDSYMLNGQKQYITNGRRAQYVAVLAKTDSTAKPPHRGMSILVAERGLPGFSVGRDFKKLGYRGVETSELFFEDCHIPVGNLIGDQEGHGFQQVMAGLEIGRLNVAARGVGLARAAYEDALAYACERETFGQPIAQHQAIQMKLADMSVAIEASRLLTQRAARLKDNGQRVDLEAGQAKLFATETAQMCALEGLRIHGGAGYIQDLPVERYVRDAPLLIVGEGTNEMQRVVIARRLLEQARG
jgi:alkylation response protein AidB-like acyl-CoA dehydrogenase